MKQPTKIIIAAIVIIAIAAAGGWYYYCMPDALIGDYRYITEPATSHSYLEFDGFGNVKIWGNVNANSVLESYELHADSNGNGIPEIKSISSPISWSLSDYVIDENSNIVITTISGSPGVMSGISMELTYMGPVGYIEDNIL